MRQKKRDERADQRYEGHDANQRPQGTLDLFFDRLFPESHMYGS